MKFRYPKYYEDFQCIAGQCEDTCCAGWEIDIDDASYDYYMSVGGEFGSRLRRSIREYGEDCEDAYEKHGFILKENRRCPFLNDNNLCDLYLALGEGALCDVCTDTPRNYLEYGGARELSLSCSCGEAGRLLYADEAPLSFVEEETDGEPELEESEEELLLAEAVRYARDMAVTILQNRKLPLSKRVIHFLHYAEKVQECLNRNAVETVKKIDETLFFVGSTDVEEPCRQLSYRFFLSRLRTFTEMDSISQEWEEILGLLQKRYLTPPDGDLRYVQEQQALWQEIESRNRLYEYEHTLVYYSFLFLARCVDDYDYLAKAKMIVISFLMLRDMDCAWYAQKESGFTKEDRVNLSRIYAKELEHSGENLAFLADELLFEEAYTVENLCLSLTIA